MKLIYLSTITIPSQLANRVQTIKMSEAFSQVCDFKLYVGKKLSSNKEIFNNYGVRNFFEIIELGIPALKPRSFFSLLRYLKIIKKEKPDFVYIREPRLAILISFFHSNLILEIHSLEDYFIFRLLAKKVKKNIVITKYLKNILKEQGKDANKILIAPDGVDIEKFDIQCSKAEARKKLNLPQDKKIIGYIGRLETLGQGKGIDILIQSFKLIKKDKKNVLLCFVGGPSKRIREYQDFAGKIGLKQKDIVFVNQVKYKLIPKYLKSFDILTMPFPRTEHYAYYMSPLKLFEYMASKRPIVTSDLPSIREILNEQNSVLVEPDNPNKLAEGIKRVLEHSNFAEKISNQAFQDVQQYTWQKRAQNILSFIKNK